MLAPALTKTASASRLTSWITTFLAALSSAIVRTCGIVRPKRSTLAPVKEDTLLWSNVAALALAKAIFPVASNSKIAVGNWLKKENISGVKVLISTDGTSFLEKKEKKLLDISPLYNIEMIIRIYLNKFRPHLQHTEVRARPRAYGKTRTNHFLHRHKKINLLLYPYEKIFIFILDPGRHRYPSGRRRQ